MFMLFVSASTPVTQELYLDEKTMTHVYVIVSASTPVTQELYLDEKTIPHVYVIVSCVYTSYSRVIF